MKLIENDSESDKLSIHQKIKKHKKCYIYNKNWNLFQHW